MANDLVLQAESQAALLEAVEEGRSRGSGSWRLAVMNATPVRIQTARDAVRKGTPRHGRDGIFFSPDGLISRGGKLAFIFPGVEGRTLPHVADIADYFGLKPFAVEQDGLQGLGAATFVAAAVIDEVLKSLAVVPDLVAGHSLGEWVGMVSCGFIEDPYNFTNLLGNEVPAFEDLTYLAVGAPAGVANEAAMALKEVTVSHDNCNHQSILCGPPDQIEVAAAELRRQQVICEVLPFKSGFHSPALRRRLDFYRSLLDGLELRPAKIPMWSGTTAAPYPTDLGEVRELFLRHLIEPVRFRELLTNLWDDGARVFVQVGAGSVNAFVDDTLTGKEHHTINTNTGQRSGMEQLRWACAALFVEGVEVDLEKLGLVSHVPGEARAPAPVAVQTGPQPQLTTAVSEKVLEAFNRNVSQALQAQEAVLHALASRPAVAVSTEAPAPAARSRDVPAGNARSRKLLLSLETYPELIDHCLFPQAPDWPIMADRGATVPMTMSVALMIEAAEAFAPGKVAVKVEKGTALDWLQVAPPLEVDIHTELLDDGRVKVSLGKYTEAVVSLADAYPGTEAAKLPPLTDVKPVALSVSQIYREKWLFHGPQYQGIVEIRGMNHEGIEGTLKVLPAGGALLDAAGQLGGLWLLLSSQVNRIAMPVRLGALEMLAPTPPAGSLVDCRVRVKYLGQRELRFDVELSSEGKVFARGSDWEDWRFVTDDRIYPAMKLPQRNLLAEQHPGGFSFVKDRDMSLANMDWVARHFLTEEEMSLLKPGGGRRQYADRLYGRIAAKDAVRSLLFKAGSGPIYPAEVIIRNDPTGKPTVAGRFSDVKVSISHTDGIAVALASTTSEPGIDVEQIEPRSEGFAEISFSAEELALLPDERRDEWLTRFWSAKEAAGKARGTGLGGAPRAIRILSVEGQRMLVEDRWVRTQLLENYVVAWTE